MKINTISPQDNKFLQILTTIAKAPNKLYFMGNLPNTRPPTVAVVGSRRPTSYGKEVTYQMSYDLAKRGLIIISGLALGVDAIAHRGALDAGGTTVAVLGGGLGSIYPATNSSLARAIVEKGGALISEYEPQVEARGFQFLERNRIVSGLSDAIIVTEAAIRSGTLSTAAHALEQGREVFVVPGNITSPLSAGCNALIKQGAHPLTNVDDVIEMIAPGLAQSQTLLPLGNTKTESTIISLLQKGIRDGDELQLKSGVEITEFSQTLTMMEISGTIRALGGNQWTLR